MNGVMHVSFLDSVCFVIHRAHKGCLVLMAVMARMDPRAHLVPLATTAQLVFLEREYVPESLQSCYQV